MTKRLGSHSCESYCFNLSCGWNQEIRNLRVDRGELTIYIESYRTAAVAQARTLQMQEACFSQCLFWMALFTKQLGRSSGMELLCLPDGPSYPLKRARPGEPAGAMLGAGAESAAPRGALPGTRYLQALLTEGSIRRLSLDAGCLYHLLALLPTALLLLAGGWP